MARKRDGRQPSQKTPTGHTIPVPTRGDVFRDLRKAARAPQDDDDCQDKDDTEGTSADDRGGAEKQE